jgi:hypothetical protein
MLITMCIYQPFANGDPHMHFLAIDPRMQMGIHRDLHMQIFAYGDLVTKSPYAYNDHM